MQQINLSHAHAVLLHVYKGRLANRCNAINVLKYGTPKIRAMKLIEELELSRCGLYAGAIVVLDRNDSFRYLYHYSYRAHLVEEIL